jgi:hypothetical protein
MDRARSALGEKRNAYGTLVGKPEGKRPLGSLRGRWRIILWRIDLLLSSKSVNIGRF